MVVFSFKYFASSLHTGHRVLKGRRVAALPLGRVLNFIVIRMQVVEVNGWMVGWTEHINTFKKHSFLVTSGKFLLPVPRRGWLPKREALPHPIYPTVILGLGSLFFLSVLAEFLFSPGEQYIFISGGSSSFPHWPSSENWC